MYCVLEFKESQCLKSYIEYNTPNRIEAEKNEDKDGKALYKLKNNAIYGKAMENLGNRINIKLEKNEKGYWNYLSQKIFQDNLVAIQKKLTLIKT